MNEAAEILVVVLSAALAIFLILAIVLTVLLIKISRQIKDVTGSAQRTTHMLETAASKVSRVTLPLTVLKAVRSQMKKVKKRK